MLILHLAAEGGFHGVLWAWAEADAEQKEQARHLRGKRPTVTVKAPEHPHNAGPDLLYSVLPGVALAEGLEGGKLQWAVAWLPSDREGPLPSSDSIAPRAGRRARRLAPWAVSSLALSPATLHGLFLGYDRGEKLAPGWRCGEDVEFWRRVLELAGALVVRQQFLPGVRETWEQPSRWFPFWWVVWEAEDLERLERLAAAMPGAARALNQQARQRPREQPRRLVRDIVMRLVDHLVWMGAIAGSVWEHSVPLATGKLRNVHERWVATLLTPDLELRGTVTELLELSRQVEAWRAPVDLRPHIEEDGPIPSSLDAEAFWKGAPVAADFLGEVVAPQHPGLILERVGEIPNWRGGRPLRDWLVPVYEAASRYALEYVFGRQPQ